MNKIKLIILDVDGVLTDGKKYYDKNGDVVNKTFCDKDWTTIKLFKVLGIKTILITGDPFNRFIEKKRNIKTIVNRTDSGHIDKSEYLEDILKENDVKSEEVCFVGDDIFDIGLMRKVGYSFCPNDSPSLVKEEATALEKNGGENLLVSLYEEIIKLNLIDKKSYEDVINDLYIEDLNDKF